MLEESLEQKMQAKIDLRLRKAVDHALVRHLPEFKAILDYQMGWDEPEGSSSRGKRLRPLILLLSTYAACGDWEQALPAAGAVELLHNFTLIHDDIQDQSPLRRGKPTVWTRWGVAQAINAGDCMLGLAQLTLLELEDYFPADLVARIAKQFNTTFVELTRGQFLDLEYENRAFIPMEKYHWMVDGKTGALISGCMEIGSELGGAQAAQVARMAEFGRIVGRAFQIQDDWLGIWGTNQITGKSAQTDLLERKKTYPVILGIEAGAAFKTEWEKLDTVKTEDAVRLARLLESDGIKKKTEDAFSQEYSSALALYESIDLPEDRKDHLGTLIKSILTRLK